MPKLTNGMGVDPSIYSTQSRLTPPGYPVKNRENIFSQLYSGLSSGRNKLAEFIAGKPDNPAHDVHESYMEMVADEMTPFLGETLTKGALTGIGNFNESMAGLFSGILGGKGAIGPQGIDINDMYANDRGMERGFARHRPKKSNYAGFGSKL